MNIIWRGGGAEPPSLAVKGLYDDHSKGRGGGGAELLSLAKDDMGGDVTKVIGVNKI